MSSDTIMLAILGVFVVLILLTFYDDLGNDIQENFFGYGYGYRVPYYYYPYFNSGCIESMFGNIRCYSPPYFY